MKAGAWRLWRRLLARALGGRPRHAVTIAAMNRCCKKWFRVPLSPPPLSFLASDAAMPASGDDRGPQQKAANAPRSHE